MSITARYSVFGVLLVVVSCVSPTSEANDSEDDSMPIFEPPFARPGAQPLTSGSWHVISNFGYLNIGGFPGNYDFRDARLGQSKPLGLGGMLAIGPPGDGTTDVHNVIIGYRNLAVNAAKFGAIGIINLFFHSTASEAIFSEFDAPTNLFAESSPLNLDAIVTVRINDPTPHIRAGLTATKILALQVTGATEFSSTPTLATSSTVPFISLEAAAFTRSAPSLAAGPTWNGGNNGGWLPGATADNVVMSPQIPVGQTVSRIDFRFIGDPAAVANVFFRSRNIATAVVTDLLGSPQATALAAGFQTLSFSGAITASATETYFLVIALPAAGASPLRFLNVQFFP